MGHHSCTHWRAYFGGEINWYCCFDRHVSHQSFPTRIKPIIYGYYFQGLKLPSVAVPAATSTLMSLTSGTVSIDVQSWNSAVDSNSRPISNLKPMSPYTFEVVGTSSSLVSAPTTIMSNAGNWTFSVASSINDLRSTSSIAFILLS